MDDAGARRHDAQVAERGLRPAQELVALAVALVLALDVEGERAGRPEPVDLHGVVDDEVGRDERVDLRRVAAEVGHRVAHDRQVDDGRDAGEVLEEDPRGHERDLGLGGGARPPGQQRLDVGRLDHAAAGVAEQVLEQDLDRDRQRARGRSGRRRRPAGRGRGGPARAARGAEWIDGCRGRHQRASFVDRAVARGQSAPGGCAHPGSKFAASIRREAGGRPSPTDPLATLDGCCPAEIGR